MRKNDVRKWIHATLDMLPLVIIPIFALAVRSDNNFQPISINITENKKVTFNQMVHNGNFVNTDYWGKEVGVTLSTSDNEGIVVSNSNARNGIYQDIQVFENHVYFWSFDYKAENVQHVYFNVSSVENRNYETTTTYINAVNRFVSDRSGSSRLFIYSDIIGSFEIKNVMLIDFTLMYGSGNEPTSQEFLQYYSNEYYDFTLAHVEYIPDYFVTLNDTDVGSQLVYTLYNSTEKYFNFNNVFTFDQIYNWLSTNIFSGQPPLSVFIVWNIFLYEFLMDLLFLLYALFMFFIDMCTTLIDRFTCQARGGR